MTPAPGHPAAEPPAADVHQGESDVQPPADAVDERAELLPEERAVGSADPQAQAEEILAESIDRTEHPDPDASTQSGRRSSDETA